MAPSGGMWSSRWDGCQRPLCQHKRRRNLHPFLNSWWSDLQPFRQCVPALDEIVGGPWGKLLMTA
eukprot:12045692-Alexandrium_andersonii.AAC.1